ncbi:hypothetical protein J437_LFUL012539, partial [Ladona fulva]
MKQAEVNMWDIWDKIMKPANIPVPEGPYATGGVDVMTDYSKDGIFMRIYYPCDLKPTASHNSENLRNVSQKGWIKWIPEYKYFEGCAKLMHIWKMLAWAGYALIAGINASIPVSWGSHFIPISKISDSNEVKKSKHPVVIVSHGMAGARFAHSALGMELASNGFVVASVEHRDGSASATYHFQSPKEREAGEKTWLPYKNVKFGNEEHYKARREQVEHRSLELIKVLDALEKINKGELGDLDNIVYKEYEGMEFSLSQMKGRLDFSHPSIIGYSFGGPSALLAIKKDPRFRKAIGLDVWMFPVKNEVKEIGEALTDSPSRDILFINSQTFHNSINLKALQTLLSTLKNKESKCKLSGYITI